MKHALRHLHRRSTARFLPSLATDWGFIVGALVLAGWADHLLVTLLVMVVVGSRQHALAILAHDGAHGLVHPNRRVNDLLTKLFCSWPLGYDVEVYRAAHFEHHRFLGTDRDPEIRFKASIVEQLPVPRGFWPRRILADMAGLGAMRVLAVAVALRCRSVRKACGPFSLLAAAALALGLTGNLWVLGVWTASFLTFFQAAYGVREWSEHAGIRGTHRFHAGPLGRFLFFPHNTWCHYEHHKWPGIPHYNLVRARALDRRERVMSVRELFGSFAEMKAPFDPRTVAANDVSEASAA